jgi:hypothetical protein
MKGDETLESWLKQQIEYAENGYLMDRSYKIADYAAGSNAGRLIALKDVQRKIDELWRGK